MKPKKMPIILTAVITILIMVVIGIIFALQAGKKNKEQLKDIQTVVTETTASVEVEETYDEPFSSLTEEMPAEDKFEFVSMENVDVIDDLGTVINCQYANNYDWDGIISREQSDYIKTEMAKVIKGSSDTINVTPAMKSVLSSIKDTIFMESIEFFDSNMNQDDICEEPPEEGEEITASSKITEDQLTYPVHYYDCMRMPDNTLAMELNENELINSILIDFPRLEYSNNEWFLKTISGEKEFQIFNYKIPITDIYSQMEGIDEFQFAYDTLRVCEDYMILGIYRGDTYFDLKVKREDGIYKILNIKEFVDVLTNIRL